MSKYRSRRGGFTLPEVLVTVAIVAILAAVVVPAVTNQISKGETGQLASALNAYSTGVTTFVTDVRRYPRALSQLTNQITAADVDVDARVYGANAASGWKGPYTGTVSYVPGDSIPIGFAAFASDTLRDTTVASRRFIMLTVATADTSVARQIDVLLDGGDGNTAGKVGWGVGVDTVLDRRVRVLLMPR